ncbi:enoyl-CoA hydratase/isomerase family protein [Litchfieldella xinjiangensis]|uniref:enoyl-CoA hydratase/isomerase family protein n=1 Tax=Litchfieldella xinjiangensis TaxID=1166948 RepID=UPI0005BE36E1|nr:enoyl-CoA hydratase/isomerase family protein [Halomonas xinjiangensis]
MSELGVLFDELPVRDGGKIGVATLNAPKSLNALSLEMIHQLDAKLVAWADDRHVVAVWLEGAGDKAFCAGGDVVAVYRAMTEDDGQENVFPETYFAAEYCLDYRIHRYPKPLLVWGDGIVMGGGLGLMAGAGYRLATETTRIAMPEITIGLFPDIGASWFLNRMPRGVGAYLGLTGAQLNSRDALDLGLADRLIPRASREMLLGTLEEADYGSRTPSELHAGVQAALNRHERRSLAPAPQVWPLLDHIQTLMACASVATATRRILTDTRDHAWLAANRARLETGCPLTAHLVWDMLARHRLGSLADAFRDEWNLAVQCCRRGDLVEGVRALLIDKDKSPRWRHASVAKVPDADIQALLAPVVDHEEHPLRRL